MLQAIQGLPQGAWPHQTVNAMAHASPGAAMPSVVAAAASGLAELTAAGAIHAATGPGQHHPRFLATGLLRSWM
jgi:hypothetical protein